ncbi:hypothetical protein HOLleu_08325 [Holothuria leucospilota]|uniref:Uncharacterized protein n=1 Tax=Holothuria leucospilota TaxID=206669 RepID=A0A9Q1CIK6_HOLLE|nr:hypothetical protein HOLleu_08325 [Holothuria leucospilota]
MGTNQLYFWNHVEKIPGFTEAIRKNRATAESTSAEIQHAVAHYLKGAGDRDGGRSQRRARANQVEP